MFGDTPSSELVDALAQLMEMQRNYTAEAAGSVSDCWGSEPEWMTAERIARLRAMRVDVDRKAEIFERALENVGMSRAFQVA